MLVQAHPEFLVTPLLMGSVCLLSQGRFEDQVGSGMFIFTHQNGNHFDFYVLVCVWLYV